MGKGSGSCSRPAMSLPGEEGRTITLGYDNRAGYEAVYEYDPETRTLVVAWCSDPEEIGKTSEWKGEHEPWEDHGIGVESRLTGARGSLDLPPLMRIIDRETAEATAEEHRRASDRSIPLSLPLDSPLSPYGFTSVILESEDPPTLAFTQAVSRDVNKLRFVKRGKYWYWDMASYGQDSGDSFGDMFGGAETFERMFAASAPAGASASTRLSKEEGLAVREIYALARERAPLTEPS